MGGKLLLALCALACFGQVSPHALTKEIKPSPKTDLQISYQTFLDAVAAVGDVNIRKEILQLFFKTPEQAVLNLADLLNRNSHPQVDEVLDVFNAGLGTRLLTINEEYVQVDVNAFEKLLSQNAVSLARVLYSKDYFRQLVAIGMFQRTIHKIVPELRPVIDASKVSVERFETALSHNNAADAIGNRAFGGIQGRSLLSELLEDVQLTLCDSVVTVLYNRFNSTLTTFVSLLDAIDVSSSDNFFVNFIAAAITFLVDLAKELIVEVDDLVKSLADSLCSDLISSSSNSTTSSRKRRDVTALQDDLNRSKALAPSFERGVATRGIIDDIWTIIWGLISSVMNTLLTTLVASALTSLQSIVDSLIQDDLGEWMYSIINSIFVVDSILRANEYTHEFKEGSVKSYDSNQLPSNNPIEDTRSEASCLLTTGFLVGVFDGHGGGACAQVVAKRLFNYITACLLPYESLLQHVLATTQPKPPDLLECYNDKVQFVEDVRDIYKKSFIDFITELAEEGYNANFDMSSAIERAVLRLDEDLSKEAMPQDGKVNMKTLSVAMSGAVSCVAHIDGPHLHIANVGDCGAVLGSLSDTNSWVAKRLTVEHNTYNQAEVDRIHNSHPIQEKQTVIKSDRLLGQLAPLRSMGDFRFKWSKEIMNELVAKNLGEQMIPSHYHTPPYLTAKPDVTYHRLTPRDKFLIIATDGLWDCLTPLQAIRLVGEHMKGKVTLNPLKLPRKNMKLNEINDMLLQRKEGLKIKPKDSNAATHIIRNALGGTEYGIDHTKISQLLTLPEDVVRVFRDDITVTIVYFDTEFLRHCPA